MVDFHFKVNMLKKQKQLIASNHNGTHVVKHYHKSNLYGKMAMIDT